MFAAATLFAIPAFSITQQEYEQAVRSNGPTGWVNTKTERLHFLRLGDLEHRDLIEIQNRRIEGVKKMVTRDCCNYDVSFADGRQELVSGADVCIRARQAPYRPVAGQLTGPAAFRGNGFPFVFLDEQGVPYARLINSNEILSIEIDPASDWEDKSGDDVVSILLYRNGIHARDAGALKRYIAKYENTDPEGLVPKARQRLAKLEQDDARRKKEGEMKLAEAAAAREREMAGWRKALKVGDDSSCGLIIEVRPPIAKVQLLSGERWLKINDLSRAGRGECVMDDRTANQITTKGGQAAQAQGLAPGTRVSRLFTGIVDRVTKRGACGHMASPSRTGCSGNVAVTGTIEQSSGERIQIRVTRSAVLENELLPVDFTAQMGEITAGSIIWDLAKNWRVVN